MRAMAAMELGGNYGERTRCEGREEIIDGSKGGMSILAGLFVSRLEPHYALRNTKKKWVDGRNYLERRLLRADIASLK